MVWEPERDTEGMRSASSTAVAKRLWNAGSQAKVNLTSASSRGFPDGEFEIEKPLFDIDTELGPCLPDFIVRARRGDDEMTFVVEVMGFRAAGLPARQGGDASPDGDPGAALHDARQRVRDARAKAWGRRDAG